MSLRLWMPIFVTLLGLGQAASAQDFNAAIEIYARARASGQTVQALSPTELDKVLDTVNQIKSHYLNLRAQAELALDADLAGITDRAAAQKIKEFYFGRGGLALLMPTLNGSQEENINNLVKRITNNLARPIEIQTIEFHLKVMEARRKNVGLTLHELIWRKANLVIGLFPKAEFSENCRRDEVVLTKPLELNKNLPLPEHMQFNMNDLKHELTLAPLPLRKEVFAAMENLKVECVQDTRWLGTGKVDAKYDAAQNKLVISENVINGVSHLPTAADVARTLREGLTGSPTVR